MKKTWRTLGSGLLMIGFLLGIHRGRLALWQGEDPHPYQIYDIPIRELPAPLRQQLTLGIRVESREELMFFLENFF